MNSLTYTIVGAAIALIALAGLYVAAHGNSEAAYWGGLAAFFLGVLADFWLINRWFDRQITPLRTNVVEAD